MNIFDKKIKQSIRETMQLDESLVAQQKPFNLKTDFLSDANINNHIELYKSYVANFNEISAKLDAVSRDANSNHSDYKNLKHDETYNLNAAYLHEQYFANIGDASSQITTDSLSYMRLTRDFGSFDSWQKDFIACGKSSRNGWVITYLNIYTQAYMNVAVDSHEINVPVGMIPVIVMDVWQHAYYRDYLKDVSTYLSAMMKQLRWNVIEERFKKADKIVQIIRS